MIDDNVKQIKMANGDEVLCEIIEELERLIKSLKIQVDKKLFESPKGKFLDLDYEECINAT